MGQVLPDFDNNGYQVFPVGGDSINVLLPQADLPRQS